MNLQTAPAYAAEVRSSFRVSSLQPRAPGELRGATGAKQDTWQPRPTCTFQTRCDKQCLATPMGVGDLRESQGLTHPGLQIAGDTPFQHPLGRGHTRPRNCASHVPCQPLGALGPARHTQPSGRAALCSRRRCLGTRLPRIGLTAASGVGGFTLLFAPREQTALRLTAPAQCSPWAEKASGRSPALLGLSFRQQDQRSLLEPFLSQATALRLPHWPSSTQHHPWYHLGGSQALPLLLGSDPPAAVEAEQAGGTRVAAARGFCHFAGQSQAKGPVSCG